MELSSEDALRLHVLITQAEAVRIDESNMIVYGLEGEREMRVELNPNCRSDKYLKIVREMLSSAVLDSPGGYPVFLRRWTRMGQIDNEQMDRLLKLGEPEAVMAVVCSPGLTDELARRAWWAAPYSEHARRMLERPKVVEGEMGRVLAEHLVEHLPFETEPLDMLATVRLVLQPGLIDEQQRQRLWDSGRTKKTYRVGFLEGVPDALPEQVVPHSNFEQLRSELAPLAEAGNPYALHLLKLLDAPGQTFLEVAEDVFRRPADQDVVSALLNAIGTYVGECRRESQSLRGIEAVEQVVEAMFADPDEPLRQMLSKMPHLQAELRALLTLAHIDESVVIPIFADTDAIGSLMRRKIEPVTGPIKQQFAVLRGRG